MSWVGLIGWFEGAAVPPETPSIYQFLIPIILMMIFMYLMISIPERRRAKQQKTLLDGLKKNDKVITAGGIYGVVVNPKVGEPDVVLRIDDEREVKIKVLKTSIARVVKSTQTETQG